MTASCWTTDRTTVTFTSELHPDPVQVGDDLDQPADHGGVHRVVIGVATSGSDPVAPGAAQHPPVPPVHQLQPSPSRLKSASEVKVCPTKAA